MAHWKTSTRIGWYCIYSILFKSKSSKCMNHFSFTYSLGSNAIEKSRLPANSRRAEVCFNVNKGVSKSKSINVNSKICCSFSK